MPTPIKEEWEIYKEKGRPAFIIKQIITARWNGAEVVATMQGWEKQSAQKVSFESLLKTFTEAKVREIDEKGVIGEVLPQGAREIARNILGMDSLPEEKGEPEGLPLPEPYEAKTNATTTEVKKDEPSVVPKEEPKPETAIK